MWPGHPRVWTKQQARGAAAGDSVAWGEGHKGGSAGSTVQLRTAQAALAVAVGPPGHTYKTCDVYAPGSQPLGPTESRSLPAAGPGGVGCWPQDGPGEDAAGGSGLCVAGGPLAGP